MDISIATIISHGFLLSLYLVICALLAFVLITIYNITLHPLNKYPGPLLWRASRLPASFHHASGDLYQHISRFHEQYGPVVRLAPDELSFADPDAWTPIYNNRPQLPKTKYHFPQPDPKKIPESMIITNDVNHARLRRLTGPAFTQTAINEVESVMQRYSDELMIQLTEVSKEEGSAPQNMVEWFLWTLNDVIGQLALDQQFDCLAKRRMHPWPKFLLAALKITAALNQFNRFGLLWLFMLLAPKEKLAEEQVFIETGKQSIRERLDKEEKGATEEQGKKWPDMIGLMLRDMKGKMEKMNEMEIIGNSILIVGAGAETTSSLLSGTLYNLLKAPRALKKLQDEIRSTFATQKEITLESARNVAYLQAVLDEGFRIFPIASYITPRVTPKGGHSIAGYWVPGNTYVSVGQWFMGRSEKFFEEPMEFKPERWLEDQKDPSGRPIKDILQPFSLGPRNCIGKQIALTEARLVLCKLLWNFDLQLEGNHDNWVDDARFYILWELQPLKVRLTPVKR